MHQFAAFRRSHWQLHTWWLGVHILISTNQCQVVG
jgi:hypothetical protein